MARRPKYSAILSTPDGLDEWFNRLRYGPLAVDTETTGLNFLTDLVGSINLAAGNTAVFCYKDALGPAARFLADQAKRRRTLMFHNGKYDLHMLRSTFGLHIRYPVHDTMLLSFLLDNRGASAFTGAPVRDHQLKSLARIFVDPDARDAEKEMLQQIRARGGKHKGDWLLADEAVFGHYSYLDPWYTLELFRQFWSRLLHWPQPEGNYPPLRSLYETEQWLLLALTDMEARGIRVRREFLEDWKQRLAAELRTVEAKMGRYTRGMDINWNSPHDLRRLLFEKLRLIPLRHTDSGVPSTDEATLVKIRHPIGPLLLKFRELTKQYTSYAESLLEKIGPDNAIHPSFKQTGAETGRLSCENPNLQQQTRDSGVRRAYIPRKGLVLRFADYSQVEMRFAADAANETSLIHGFCHDPDFDAHTATAQKMYGVSEPTAKQRKFAKITNFTTIYGGGENQVYTKLTEMLTRDEAKAGLRESGYRLRVGEDPHRALAQLIRARYFQQLPNMRRATYRAAEIAERRGFVMNAFGRHRYMDGDRWYRAFNTEIQGTAADQAKAGLVKLYRELQLGSGEIALMLQIHDEVVYESLGDPATDRRVLELLNEPSRFKVPIIADISGSATSWQDKQSIKL